MQRTLQAPRQVSAKTGGKLLLLICLGWGLSKLVLGSVVFAGGVFFWGDSRDSLSAFIFRDETTRLYNRIEQLF